MAIRFFDPAEPPLAAQASRDAKYQAYRSAVTPQMAQQVTQMFRTNPNLRPGTGLALARAGVDPEGALAQEAAKREAQRRQEKGFGWHSIGDAVAGAFGKASDAVGAVAGAGYSGLKTFSRGTFIGLEALPQTFQGAMRESVSDGDIQGSEWLLGLPHLAKGFSQTNAATAIDELRREGVRGADYGSGFFAGGDVRAEQIRRARAAAPLIDNHAVTIGRYSAKRVFEPGSTQYSVLSGVIDAGVMLGADPTSWLGGGAGLFGKVGSRGARDAIERGRTFTGSTGDVVRETAVEMTPARLTAKQFGDDEITAGQFLDRAVEFGSDNPGVTSAVRSMQSGELSRDDVITRLEQLKPRIAVEAGLVEGTRRTVLSDVANDWLTMNKQGRASVQAFVKSQSVAELRRATKGQIDTEVLVKLAAAKDENQVISVLGPLLGRDIRERPVIGAADQAIAAGETGFRVKVKNARASSRWLQMMPHSAVDLDDLDDVVEQIDRLGATVKMPLEVRDEFVNRMAMTSNRNERLDVTKKFMDRIADDVLDGARLDPNQRQALTRLYGTFDDVDQFRTYALNAHGQPALVPGAPVLSVNGEMVALPSPHLLSEHVGQYMPLPDPHELRRATSKVMGTLGKIPGATRAADALIVTSDTINKVFKAGALARVAYPIRVIGEEQARMAASGLHSTYANPLSYLAIITGKAGSRDLLDEPFAAAAEHGDAMSVGSAGMFGPTGKVKVPGKFAVDRTNPDFARALADNLSEFHNDALAKRVAMGRLFDNDATPNPLPGLDGIKDWFFHGAGRSQRKMLATGSDARGASAARADIFAKKYDPEDALNSADGYVDSLVTRLKDATNGDPRLMDAIATGKINGVPLMRQVAPKQFKPNPDAVKAINEILAEGAEVGPAYAKGDAFLNPKGQDPSFAALGRVYDSAVEKMFEYLMSKPTNYLSRNPAFVQFYWKRQAELIRFMDPQVQQAALDVARRTNLPPLMMKRLEQGAAARSGTLTADEADQLSKAFGVDSTRKLLYDLHNRNQFFDAMRVVFPFGEAFKEVATTWARIGLKENPLAFRRGQQIVNGLRNANIDGEDEGLFFTNGNGEESFAIPFSGWINEKITGVDARLTAPVKGLNVFGSSVIPGLGPVITMPLAKVIPNRPEFQDFNELLFPFGEKEYTDGALGGFGGSLMPTWSQKIKQAMTADPNKDRIFANHVAYSARYLLSTGKYSLDTAEEKDRLEQDSIKAARRLFMLRGLAQIWAPSAPSQEYVALDKNGDGVLQSRLVEEYQKLLNDTAGGGYKTATERFVERFGEQAILGIVARTSGGAPPTDETNTFATSNPDVVRKYRDVYGFFLERGGEFNYQAYKDQIASGERAQVTPKEALEIANQRLGQMVYNQYKTQVGERPNAAQKQWLGQVRDAIETQYPGFNATPASLRSSKLLITKMVEAAGDPVLSKTEAGQGLSMYLQLRQQALAEAQSRGLKSFTNAKAAKDLRTYLRDGASEIEIQYPAFGELFERTFNREMIADDES